MKGKRGTGATLRPNLYRRDVEQLARAAWFSWRSQRPMTQQDADRAERLLELLRPQKRGRASPLARKSPEAYARLVEYLNARIDDGTSVREMARRAARFSYVQPLTEAGIRKLAQGIVTQRNRRP